MVNWTDRPTKTFYDTTLLGGTRDDRLRTFGDTSTESELADGDLFGTHIPTEADLEAAEELDARAFDWGDKQSDLEERSDWSERLQQTDSLPW